MRATLLLLAGLLLAGCGPDEELSLRTLGRPLVGVPQDGYPNYNERLMLVAINRCRADPNVEGETKSSCSADRSIYPPLMRNQNGSRCSRFHCANCIINDGGLTHSSYCTVRSDIGDTFEDTCDGSANCACEPGSEHFTCDTLGGHGTGVGTRCGYFGYGASGEVGAAGYGDGWSAVWGWVSECPADGDGHRRILTGGYDEIGLGFYTGSTQCWSRLYFGDLGNNAPFTYTLPAGVHRSRSGTYDFLVNYYDAGGAPDSVDLVLDGTCYPMTLEIGNADNATYKVNLDIGSGCHQYWFLVRDSSFNRVVYPEQGAWGVGSCTDYVPLADVADCEVCTPGESKPCGLGQCAGTQACNAGGTWDPCDGADPDPGESCDGEDNDCDGSIPADEADADSDGHRVCAGDCDDSDGSIHPGAADPCDGIDQACDGIGDEVDSDGDTAMVCDGDCDDSDADRHPGAQEICDGKDNDCDGSAGPGEVDADSDTYMVCENDCDDSDIDVNPAAAEDCNGVDDNCDGSTDEICDCTHGESRSCGSDVGECRAGTQTCEAGVWGDCQGGVEPATEECNGLDDNCDGSTDEGCACTTGESRPCGNDVGECEAGTQTCQAGAWGACEGGVLPQDEECNGLDDNCDGTTDEGCPDPDPDPDPVPVGIEGSCSCGSPEGSGLLLVIAGIYPLLRRRRRMVTARTAASASQEKSPAKGS